jgi:hypothetical protein
MGSKYQYLAASTALFSSPFEQPSQTKTFNQIFLSTAATAPSAQVQLNLQIMIHYSSATLQA